MGHYGQGKCLCSFLGIVVDCLLANPFQRLSSQPDTGWCLQPKAVKSWIGTVVCTLKECRTPNYHGRTQPNIAGGGQSEVQKGTLLMMMIWHQKKGTGSQKGHFFPRLPGGGGGSPPLPPPLGTALTILYIRWESGWKKCGDFSEIFGNDYQ